MADEDRAALLAEAYKRDILPPEVKSAYEQALSRGLVQRAPQPGDLSRKVGTFATGANDAIASIVGAPGAILNTMNEGVGKAFEYGREMLVGARTPEDRAKVEAFDAAHPLTRITPSGVRSAIAATIGRTEPVTPGERIAYRAGGEVPAALTIAAGVPPVARLAGAPMVADALAINTPGQLANQATVAAGAGAGAGAAHEKFPNSPLAETVGGLAGGGTAAAGYAGLQASLRGIWATIAPFFARGQEEIAANALRRHAVHPDQIETAIGVGRSGAPLASATTAEVSGDPGLMQLERSLRAGDPKLAGNFAIRDAERNAERRGLIEGAAPGNAGPPATREFFETALRRAGELGEQQIAKATSEVDRRLATLGPGQSPTAAGQVIREEYDAALKAAKQRTGAAFDAVDPGNTTSIPLTNAKAASSEAFGRIFAGPDASNAMGRGAAPEGITSLMADIGAAGQEAGHAVPLAHIQNLRSRALALASEYGRAGDNRAASVARSLAQHLDDAVAEAAASGTGMDAGTAARWQAARAARAEQGAAFEQGASGTVGKTRGYGEPVKSVSEVPAAYFNATRGGPDDAAKFIQALGDRPRAVTALQDHAVNDVRAYATNPDGTINPDRWRAWMDRHAGALRQFPELRQQLDTVGGAQRALDAAGERATQSLATVETSAARFFLKNDPDKAIAAALSGSRPQQNMAELVNLANHDSSGAALNGIRRGIVDHALQSGSTTATTATGDQLLSPASFIRWWQGNREAVAPAFDMAQRRVFDAVARDLESRARVDTVGRAIGSNTAQNINANFLLDTLLPGSKVPQSAIPQAVGKVLGWVYKLAPDDSQRLLYDAMLNPSTAQALLTRATPANAPQLNRALSEAAARVGIALEADTPTRGQVIGRPLQLEIRNTGGR